MGFQVRMSPSQYSVLTLRAQYGYHISALNQIKAVLTCRELAHSEFTTRLMVPTCIPMSDFTFSVVTSIFTVGGLVGSMVANLATERWGRKGASKASAFLTTCGAAIMGLSTDVYALAFGR
jgi:MFS family permease